MTSNHTISRLRRTCVKCLHGGKAGQLVHACHQPPIGDAEINRYRYRYDPEKLPLNKKKSRSAFASQATHFKPYFCELRIMPPLSPCRPHDRENVPPSWRWPLAYENPGSAPARSVRMLPVISKCIIHAQTCRYKKRTCIFSYRIVIFWNYYQLTRPAAKNRYISARIIAGCAAELVVLVAKICNAIITEVFPERWRRANTIPSFNKGDKDQSNYWSVSLLRLFIKTLGRLVYDRLYIISTFHRSCATSSTVLFPDALVLTRALLGLWIFHRLLGGGGGVWTRGAPDSGFRYPAGYRIGRIVPSYPAG